MTTFDYKDFPVMDCFSGVEPTYEHRVYNTGDEIWLMGEQVVAIRTHDGIEWSVQDSSLRIPTP